jgi:hypothetical protein
VHVPLILATLIVCIAAIALLRLRWPRLSLTRKRRLVSFAVAYLFLFPVALFSGIVTTFEHFNTLVYWGFICSYIFLVILLTLLRPLWLTSLVAVILILPLLSASVFLPLGGIFSTKPHIIRSIGRGFYTDLDPIDAVTAGASGADLSVYQRRSWAPFLQHKFIGVRYFNTQCNAAAAYAEIKPESHGMLLICPVAPGFPPEDTRRYLLPLTQMR